MAFTFWKIGLWITLGRLTTLLRDWEDQDGNWAYGAYGQNFDCSPMCKQFLNINDFRLQGLRFAHRQLSGNQIGPESPPLDSIICYPTSIQDSMESRSGEVQMEAIFFLKRSL